MEKSKKLREEDTKKVKESKNEKHKNKVTYLSFLVQAFAQFGFVLVLRVNRDFLVSEEDDFVKIHPGHVGDPREEQVAVTRPGKNNAMITSGKS